MADNAFKDMMDNLPNKESIAKLSEFLQSQGVDTNDPCMTIGYLGMMAGAFGKMYDIRDKENTKDDLLGIVDLAVQYSYDSIVLDEGQQ